ncbi:peptidoglycan-binding protein [Kribbella sp.]|uniref:peptidoglycan-binding protein n=1 Tax=Kribbella sp. TaxID=1871183 RepID=UPI002D3A5B3D|nr:peptidoglycan-binding protein [Kribbella sp.]HZX08370.1 peptidoglycan-binding protein [Kribbella sp.]
MSASRRTVLAGVGLSVVAGAAGGWVSQRTPFRPAPAAGATEAAPLSTAAVVRTDLRTTRQYYGTIGYGPTVDLVATTSGQAFTWLPAPGAVIQPDDTLFEADGRTVPVLAGVRPMWRALHRGLRGPDVAQLNTALARLGYRPALTGSVLYGRRTETAVRRWQRAHHFPRTGVVDLGQLVFARLPLRVDAVQAKLGQPVQPGTPLLAATSPALVVAVPVPVDQAYLLHRGAAVTVTLPDAVTTSPGTVADLARAATLPDPAAQDTRNGNPQTAVVNATIRLARPSLATPYSSAPVQVAITIDEVKGALAVPITALLARPDGGFAITVVNRGDVPVRTGLSTDTMVQVSGTGVTAGTRVLVAAS